MSEFKLIEKTLGQILDHAVDRYSHKTAFVFTESELRLTWKELQEEVDTIAKGLIAIGIQKGEKIAVWSPNVPHWITFLFASAKIGAILITVNTNYRSSELLYTAQAIRM